MAANDVMDLVYIMVFCLGRWGHLYWSFFLRRV